jgi:hypothetical protein
MPMVLQVCKSAPQKPEPTAPPLLPTSIRDQAGLFANHHVIGAQPANSLFCSYQVYFVERSAWSPRRIRLSSALHACNLCKGGNAYADHSVLILIICRRTYLNSIIHGSRNGVALRDLRRCCQESGGLRGSDHTSVADCDVSRDGRDVRRRGRCGQAIRILGRRRCRAAPAVGWRGRR